MIEKNFTHKHHFSRTNLFRSSLAVAFLCIVSAFFPLSTPTAHAATSRSSFMLEALRKAGYIELKPSSYAPLPATNKTASPVAPNCPTCVYQFNDNLFSGANRQYVATEVNYPGPTAYAMLRARSSTPGPSYNWYIDWRTNTYVIQSTANNLYVSADISYTGSLHGMLIANRSIPGSWEQFGIYTKNGCNPISSNCIGVIFAQDNLLYVSVELNYTGNSYAMLRARSGSYGPWEAFYI